MLQAPAGNHALLSLWGRNAWLLLTDLDELFATGGLSSVVEMLREPDGCLLHGRSTRDWFTSGRPEQIHVALIDVYCATCPIDGHGERKLLLSNESLTVMRHWTVRYD